MASSDAETAGSEGSSQEAAISALAGAFGSSMLAELMAGDSILETYAGESLIELEEKAMQAIKEEIEAIEDIPEDSIEVTVDELGVHIQIKDTVLFKSGSPNINPEAKPILKKIGHALKSAPNNYIQIEGHTDDIPMSGTITHLETNWELASLRAVKVLRNFVTECALNPNFLTATSYGEHRPIAENSTVEGRAQNRRVEITVLRNYLEVNSTANY